MASTLPFVIQLTLMQVQVAVGHLPDRGRVLTFLDERSGIQVTVPFEPLVAAKIGHELAQGAADANGVGQPG